MSKDRLTVLHITTGLENGGAEGLLYTLIKSDHRNVHIVLSLYRDGFHGPRLRELGVRVDSLNMPRSRLTFSGIKKLISLVRQSKADVIQCWMYHGNFLGGIVGKLFSSTPVFWGLHNADMEHAGISTSLKIADRLCRYLSRVIPVKVVHSSKRGYDLAIADGYSSDKMMVIHSGYDTNRFASNSQYRTQTRSQFGVADEVFLVGMVARWNAQKDHENMLSSYSLFRQSCSAESRLLLVGPDMGVENNELQSLVQKYHLKDHVILAGPHSEIEQLINGLDVHVLSSAFGESFPNIVNECMASEVPCIVTDVGDSAYIVGDTGWVVQPSDASALGAAIVEASELWQTPVWQKHKASSRARIVANFSADALVVAYNTMWRSGVK